MSKNSSMNRVLTILKYLNNGNILNIEELAYEFNVSTRTIRRDVDLIEDSFEDNFIQKEKTKFYAIKKDLLNDVLQGNELATLMQILNVSKEKGEDLFRNEHLNKLKKESSLIYKFTDKPFENLTNKKQLKDLEKAIKYKQNIDIKYKREDLENINFNPYKIILLNENFYLVGFDANKEDVIKLRVGLIKEVELNSKTFYHDYDILKYIENIQTPWTVFGNKDIIVEVISSKRISKYFEMKKYLPSQKIIKEFEDGRLLIQFKVSDFKDIEELLIKWLPEIEIISPLTYKDKLKKILEMKINYLEN